MREIVGVLFEEGGAFVFEELDLHYLAPMMARWRHLGRRGNGFASLHKTLDPPMPVRLRRAFERLGPSFVKFGQILSMRPDIVPADYVAEFSHLQDNVPGLTKGVAEKIVENALGQPIENIFSRFDEQPLASASLAVVHRATLRDGREVVVKIRRPQVEKIVRNDIHILAYLANLMESRLPASRRFGPVRFVAEFADWTIRELDFELEAANLDRFREMFADEPQVIIPAPVWSLTKGDVLVMDYVPGIKVDDFAALEKAGIDRRELAVVGFGCGVRQFFYEGFFHADPHPGNLVAVPPEVGSDKPVTRVALYDFGMTGTLSKKSRYELLSCFMSFVNKDLEAYARHILDIADSGEQADTEGFLREARRIATDVMYKPNERKGVAQAFYRILLAGVRYDVRFPTDLVLMGKAFFTLENIGFRLYPEIDLSEIIRPHLAEMLKRELNPVNAIKEMQSSAFDSLYFLKHLPDQTRALLDRLERGEVGVKLNLTELQDMKREFDRQNDVRILAIVVAVVFLGSAVAMRVEEKVLAFGLPVGEMGIVFGLLGLLWLLVLVSHRPRP